MKNANSQDLNLGVNPLIDPVSEPDAEAAWSEEIRRRVAEIDAGTVELIPCEEVRGKLFGQSDKCCCVAAVQNRER